MDMQRNDEKMAKAISKTSFNEVSYIINHFRSNTLLDFILLPCFQNVIINASDKEMIKILI